MTRESRQPMMRQMTGLPLLLTLLSVFTGTARADDGETARAKFQEGVTALKAEDFPRALMAFELSYALNPKPVVLYNIGMCQKALFKYQEALATFTKLLEVSAEALSPARREEATRVLDTLAAQVARLDVSSATDNADIYVNGRLMASTPLETPLALNPGQQVVEVRKQGFTGFRRELTLEMGETRTISVPALSPIETPTGEPVSAQPEDHATEAGAASRDGRDERDSRRSYRARRLLFAGAVATLSLGVGGLMTGGIYTYLWNSEYKDLERDTRVCNDRWRDNCPDVYNSHLENLDTDKVLLISGYVVGGVMATAGTILTIFYWRKRGRPVPGPVTLTPGGLRVRF